MAGLNKVIIIGNCGKDPEMRFVPSGSPVTSFSVAVSSKSGETKTTEWFNVVALNKLAESCNKFLVKGKQVYVEGRLQTSSWEKDGQKHYKTEVIANKVLFLGSRDKGKEATGEVEPDNEPF